LLQRQRLTSGTKESNKNVKARVRPAWRGEAKHEPDNRRLTDNPDEPWPNANKISASKLAVDITYRMTNRELFSELYAIFARSTLTQLNILWKSLISREPVPTLFLALSL
jgi:hypothetical protein